MIATWAILKISEGKAAEFEAIFADMAAKVRANEPGCSVYRLCKSRADPDTYKVFEVYADESAFSAHMATEHFKVLGGAMVALFAGPPDFEILDTVD